MSHLTYLAMLLPWALPVIALQWAVGWRALRQRLRVIVVAALVTTAYLSAADAVAITQGIWTIHSERIVGARIGAVPIEEVLFFLLTNLMVIQSVVLFNAPEMHALARRLVQRRTRG
jgi:putative membrane protein